VRKVWNVKGGETINLRRGEAGGFDKNIINA
jgi:hypothetical protein